MSNETVLEQNQTAEIIVSQSSALETLSKELAEVARLKDYWSSKYFELSAMIKKCYATETTPKPITVQIDPNYIANKVLGGRSDGE